MRLMHLTASTTLLIPPHARELTIRNCDKSIWTRFLSLVTSLVTALALTTLVLLTGLPTPAQAQVNVVTYHYDNARTGQNVEETLLTPANVNKNSFGLRFSQAVDGFIIGQPLYLSNVAIPGAGTHNVVYVATLNDSVYAFDADSNAAPLWQVNFTNPSAGITTASGSFLPCPDVTGYPQAGIVSTPVIDPATGTMYVVAKTNENGTVYHRLHALDVTTGVEKFGPAVAIEGTFTATDGTKVTFNSLHAMNRPALLLDKVLLNTGIIYIAFGSNGCNDSSHGWMLAYDATTLEPLGIYNTAPKKGLGSIWHSGSGPATDADGNVYVSTAEADFNAPTGQDFGSSVLRLVENESAGTLTEADYFTPHNQAILSADDLDLSASGVVVLPDQPSASPHVLVASGKEGTVYLLDRDNMGQYHPVDNILQEFPKTVGAMFSTPAYWNNTVYFAGNSHPIMAYALAEGELATPPVAQSIKMPGGHSPTISAHGNTNGVLWVIGGPSMWAFDAVSLAQLYNTSQAGTRDALPQQASFSTQMVANGKVYIGTKTDLMVYGLLPALAAISGNQQSAPVHTTLKLSLQVRLTDPYTGDAVAGVTLTFSDGAKGGTFGTPSPVTDSTGTATTTYTFGTIARSVTITASNPGVRSVTFTETATPGPAKWVVLSSGGNQSAQVTASLPAPVVVKVTDQYGNSIAGMSVTFADGGAGGSFSANPVTTNGSGLASTIYTTSTKAGAITLTATGSGLDILKISETVAAGPPAAVTIIAGNNQTGPPSTTLPQALTVRVTDRYGNPVPGASTSYSDGGAGGSFSATPVSTDSTGEASCSYTTPSPTGTIKITVSAGSAQATFTETSQ